MTGWSTTLAQPSSVACSTSRSSASSDATSTSTSVATVNPVPYAVAQSPMRSRRLSPLSHRRNSTRASQLLRIQVLESAWRRRVPSQWLFRMSRHRPTTLTISTSTTIPGGVDSHFRARSIGQRNLPLKGRASPLAGGDWQHLGSLRVAEPTPRSDRTVLSQHVLRAPPDLSDALLRRPSALSDHDPGFWIPNAIPPRLNDTPQVVLSS